MGAIGIPDFYFNPEPSTHAKLRQALRNYYRKEGYEVLDDSLRAGAYYAAIRLSSGEVIGLVILVSKSKRGEEIFLKEMSEFEGPVKADAPKRLIRQLTPLEEIERLGNLPSRDSLEFARRWRDRCLAQSSDTSGKRLKPGDRIHFEEPVRMGDGTYVREAEKVSIPRRKGVFRDLERNRLVRLSGHALRRAIRA